MRELTLLSLFDGSGGFPLAASMCGIRPVACSEVEPYPIAVTKSRFPNMKHLGSVTDTCGCEIEPVDIITFGSPCQDLSVAGKRAGLKHEANGDDETTRSGLFMEAVRIIKEMREATNGEYPTFAVWENVPGAFSSNKGDDFRVVLEELIKIVEPTAVMPAVPKNGWPYADSYCGDGWSLAYRVFDAQYWGVPQRRRRIYLVLDLRGQRAREVLFERQGLRGDFATFKTAGQGTAGDAANRAGADDCEGAIPINTMIATRHKQLGRGTGFGVGEAGDPQFTISAGHEHAVAYTLKICDENILDDQGGQQITVRTDGKAPTLRAETHGNLPAVMEPVTIEPGIAAREGGHIYEGVCGTLMANAGDNQMAVAYAAGFKAGQGAQARSIGWEDEKCPTLAAEAGGNSVPSVCIKECLPFDTTQVTSPQNGCNPKWGDPCHPLAAQGHPPTVICKCYDKKAYSIENHPADSRVDIDDSGKVQTLTSRMGTGGGNVPMVMEPKPVYCLQGSMIGREDKNGPQGDGVNEETSYTLNTIDRHAVVFKTYQKVTGPLMANSHPGSYTGQDAFSDMLVAGVDCRNGTEYPEMTGTLQAKPNGVFSLNCNQVVRVQYIVRRLTPTECARLQGFPDDWGHPDHKEDFTDEEYRFWLNVRNTHAAINGKAVKTYTKEQMLTWYNGLHTDSSEYKMWGNGIALPCALYVMQGIQDALGSCCTVQDGSEKKTVSDHEKEIMRGLLLDIGRKLEELEERIREVLA